MEWIPLSIIYLSGILIAVYNAYIILWGLSKKKNDEKTKKYSKAWHSQGLWIRFLIIALVLFLFLYPFEVKLTWSLGIKHSLTILLVFWHFYDFIINFIRNKSEGKPSIWYIDNKGVNAIMLWLFRKPLYIWVFRGVWVLATIFCWIFI